MSVNKHNSTAILASFATLKSLLDEKKYKSSYQVLQEFIHYITINESIFLFFSIEIKNHLYNYFGFSIPEAVIKTAAKKMTGVQLNNGSYTVRFEELGNDSLFQDKKKEADQTSLCMDFSPEYLSRYEEEFKANQQAVKQKDEIIKSLDEEREKGYSVRDAKIANQKSIIEEKNNENKKLQQEIEKYQKKEDEHKKTQQKLDE